MMELGNWVDRYLRNVLGQYNRGERVITEEDLLLLERTAESVEREFYMDGNKKLQLRNKGLTA